MRSSNKSGGRAQPEAAGLNHEERVSGTQLSQPGLGSTANWGAQPILQEL